jgi:CPA1 family monovalent cation:H+ antiporter
MPPGRVEDLEFLIALLAAIALLAQLAVRLGIPYPVFLVLGGLGIAVLPGAPRIDLEPDVVFLVFLPPLLYSGAFSASPRDLRAEWRRISALALALVVLTVVAVALLAHALFEDLSWPLAFALGAILAPTDPVAALAVFRRAEVPARLTTVIEGEALVNDGVSLTLYRVAVGAATAGTFSLGSAALQLVLVTVGGVAIGLAVGWVIVHLRRRVQEPEVEIALSLFTPYAAYIAAESAHSSGILAAVAVGLYVGWRQHDILLPETRVRILSFWSASTFLLESLLFVLVGLQLPAVLDTLEASPTRYVAPALAVAATVVLVRLAFMLGFGGPVRDRLVIGWSGMRGAISLAAALAVPLTTDTGAALAGRDVLVLVAFLTILVTLVAQGLTLPLLLRATGLRADAEAEEQELRARLAAAEAALELLDSAAAERDVPATTVERLRSQYAEHAERAAAELDHEV